MDTTRLVFLLTKTHWQLDSEPEDSKDDAASESTRRTTPRRRIVLRNRAQRRPRARGSLAA
jgi:hypothetical protein